MTPFEFLMYLLAAICVYAVAIEKTPFRLWYAAAHNWTARIPADRNPKCDLVVIDGVFNGMEYDDEVALFLNSDAHFTIVGKIDVHATQCHSFHCSYKYCKVPNKMVRAFAIKKSKSRNESRLTQTNQDEIRLICTAMRAIIDEHQSHNIDIYHSNTHLAFGIISHKFGFQGFNYAFSDLILKLPDSSNETRRIFNAFYQKHFWLKPRLLLRVAVRTGDLVNIQSLKPQKNETLQNRARHFDESFGEISTFLSGVLMRGNSRNQTEFVVQSLFDNTTKLALRPKYLSKITMIYVHRLPLPKHFSLKQFQHLVTPLFESQSNKILHLPHRDMGDGKIGDFYMTDFAVFMLQSRDKPQMLFDVGISSFTSLIYGPIQISEFANALLSFPFYFDEIMWQNVKDRMRINATSQERRVIRTLDLIIGDINARFMNFDLVKDGRRLHKWLQRWGENIQVELTRLECKQHAEFYSRLFAEIRNEMLGIIQGLHPDYFKQYYTKTFIGIRSTLRNLYRVSVVQNYLKANSEGCDLHVIYYGDQEECLSESVNFALSEKINVEWNINNMNVTKILTNRIVHFQEY